MSRTETERHKQLKSVLFRQIYQLKCNKMLFIESKNSHRDALDLKF